jgi:hypothetical protein
VLLEGLTFEVEDLLVDLENTIGLAAELETAEGKSCLNEHEYWHFRFQREPIPW